MKNRGKHGKTDGEAWTSSALGPFEATLSFSGSGVSTVLELLKPLIQGFLKQHLSELICGNVDKLIDGQGPSSKP